MADTSSTTGAAAPARRWSDALRVYGEPASLRMFFLGFAAGLPLLLVLGTLSFRLREAGIDRTTIGYLSWVGLAYGVKWAWAPLVDRLPLPLLSRALGRRRGWLLLAQSGPGRARECQTWNSSVPACASHSRVGRLLHSR